MTERTRKKVAKKTTKKTTKKSTAKAKDSGILPQVLIDTNKKVAVTLTGSKTTLTGTLLQIAAFGVIFKGLEYAGEKAWDMGKDLISRNNDDNVVDLRKVS